MSKAIEINIMRNKGEIHVYYCQSIRKQAFLK